MVMAGVALGFGRPRAPTAIYNIIYANEYNFYSGFSDRVSYIKSLQRQTNKSFFFTNSKKPTTGKKALYSPTHGKIAFGWEPGGRKDDDI